MEDHSLLALPVACDIDGADLLVEVLSADGISEAGLGAKINFKAVETAVAALSRSILQAIKAGSPSEAAVELAIGCSVEGNQILAVLLSGEAKASIKVKLKWSAETQPGSSDRQ